MDTCSVGDNRVVWKVLFRGVLFDVGYVKTSWGESKIEKVKMS
jgi:hypothetical protein